MQFTETHDEIRTMVREFVQRELNPNADEWEEAKIFPAHEVFKKLGDLGLLGLTRPEKYGGMGLDFSYSIVMSEELGLCRSPALSMAIGVHTDMCTPALANYGSEELKQEFLAPSIAGDVVGCVGGGCDVLAVGGVVVMEVDAGGGVVW